MPVAHADTVAVHAVIAAVLEAATAEVLVAASAEATRAALAVAVAMREVLAAVAMLAVLAAVAMLAVLAAAVVMQAVAAAMAEADTGKHLRLFLKKACLLRQASLFRGLKTYAWAFRRARRLTGEELLYLSRLHSLPMERSSEAICPGHSA
jgi:hypothetical protein